MTVGVCGWESENNQVYIVGTVQKGEPKSKGNLTLKDKALAHKHHLTS